MKKTVLNKLCLTALMWLFSFQGFSQHLNTLWDQYENYKEQQLKDRFFKHKDLVPIIEKYSNLALFKVNVLGKSGQGRAIYHLSAGKGKTKVLLWSQMHGDETTATRALFDLFNFLTTDDAHNALRKDLLEKLELHFVPMLNPDGAEVFKRRNAQDIDINRDARLLATPEGNILMDIAKKIKPDFGFNLHDQSTLYSAGVSPNTATISFLDPAYNYPKEMNEVRKKARQVILLMNTALQAKIPDKVAKYNDDFDPRCFGDTFQGMGIATILIESGGYAQDLEKEYIRKLNFYALLNALDGIAHQSYEKVAIGVYDDIPENNRSLYHVLVRNVMFGQGRTFKTNLGINLEQIKQADYKGVNYQGSVAELGDVERVYGYDEVDASGLSCRSGKVKMLSKKAWGQLKPEEAYSLIKAGYLYVKWTDGQSPSGPVRNKMLNLSNKENPPPIGLGQPANLLLMKGDEPVYAIINGFLLDLSKPYKALPNTFGY